MGINFDKHYLYILIKIKAQYIIKKSLFGYLSY